jgi:hypothetical protein
LPHKVAVIRAGIPVFATTNYKSATRALTALKHGSAWIETMLIMTSINEPGKSGLKPDKRGGLEERV